MEENRVVKLYKFIVENIYNNKKLDLFIAYDLVFDLISTSFDEEYDFLTQEEYDHLCEFARNIFDAKYKKYKENKSFGW